MKKNAYTKPIERLTNQDKKVLASAQATLEAGGRLYGIDDTSHVTWTIGFIIDALKRSLMQCPDTYQACILEIGVSREGTGIRVLIPKQADSEDEIVLDVGQ